MTYHGAGHDGAERCPTCGYTMLNGVCYNTDGHRGTGGGAGTYTPANSLAGELGATIVTLLAKRWKKHQENKKKEE